MRFDHALEKRNINAVIIIIIIIILEVCPSMQAHNEHGNKFGCHA